MEEEKANNTLTGFHINGRYSGIELKLHSKEHTWHIPKNLRGLDIQSGDIVAVGKDAAPFLVTEVFREEFEDTGKSYKRVKGIIRRAKKE